ncbi:MAG: hypothetical protein KC657_39015 [Myxococcales bacterium]|nr:hypothetical protein [Myxococcales bacterium]
MSTSTSRIRTFLALASLAMGAVAIFVACDGDTSTADPADASAGDSTTPSPDTSAPPPDTGGGSDGSTPDASTGDASDGGVTPSFGAITVRDLDAPLLPKIGGGSAELVTDRTKSSARLPAIGQCAERPKAAAAQTSAGTIALMVGGAADSGTLTFDGTKYSGLAVAGLLGVEGQSVSASASGAAVPAFTTSVTGPTRVALNLPDDGGIQISKAADFTFTWTGGVANQILQLNLSRGPNDPVIFCAFDAAAGTGTVPSALLMKLVTGINQFYVSVITSSSADAGPHDIQLLAEVAFFSTNSTVN